VASTSPLLLQEAKIPRFISTMLTGLTPSRSWVATPELFLVFLGILFTIRFWCQLQTTLQYVCGPQRRNIATLKIVQSEQFFPPKISWFIFTPTDGRLLNNCAKNCCRLYFLHWVINTTEERKYFEMWFNKMIYEYLYEQNLFQSSN
jgi:hypothetical protein